MALKKVKKAAKASKKVSANSGKRTLLGSSKKSGPVAKTFTKTEILSNIAEGTGLAQRQVGGVIEALYSVIERHIKKGGPGSFVLPGLIKVLVIHKPATKPRKGVNPFTGEYMTFKAKPARNVIKVKALKRLKEMV